MNFFKTGILFVRNIEHLYHTPCRNVWVQCTSNGIVFTHQAQTNCNQSGGSNIKRIVPLSNDEYKNLKTTKPSQPENPRLLKVSILGEPNVGKSTLTNSLVKWRVCAVSRKVHTTRKRARAVLVEDNTQIVFLDTPGFVTPEKSSKHSLEATFIMDPVISVTKADLIAVVVDISDKWNNNRINPEILRILYDYKDKKSILILNKIDAMKSKGRLLNLTRILMGNEGEKKSEAETKEMSVADVVNDADNHLTETNNVDSSFYENIDHKRGWPLFSKVFMVSALKNDGVDDLRNYLLSEAVESNWVFNEGMVTDQHPHDIALQTVRENLLEYLPNEIPYKINLKITKWEMLSTGCPKINIKIICVNSRHKRFVLGPNGKHIAACAAKCKKAMKESFRRDVVLNLAVA